METEKALPTAGPSLMDRDELKRFYKQDILNILRKVFFAPVEGTYSLFVNRSERTYFHSLILIISSAFICMIFTYLTMPSEIRAYMPVITIMMKTGIASVVLLLLISSASFGIKLISGKVSFKNELLTGGLCGLPFSAFILLLFIFSKIFFNETQLTQMMMGGVDSIINQAGIFLAVTFYILLMFINILQQSLRAAGTKDLLVWYLSPAGILLSFYFTVKIMQMI